MEAQPFDVENLWKRIGLEELRSALKKIGDLTKKFESALAGLPECDQCARVLLLDRIQVAGMDLGGEVISLVSLAGTLKNAVAATEKIQEELFKNRPNPCRCPEGRCVCH